MVCVTQEVIETIVNVKNRNSKQYFWQIADEVLRDNKALFKAIVDNADAFIESLHEHDENINSDLLCHIRTNMISACLATYQSIKAQTEINELEKIYD